MTQGSASSIRKARVRRGLTLLQVTEQCAERGLPISEGHLSRIERGQASGSPRTRAVLAEVLELDAYDDFEVRSA